MSQGWKHKMNICLLQLLDFNFLNLQQSQVQDSWKKKANCTKLVMQNNIWGKNLNGGNCLKLKSTSFHEVASVQKLLVCLFGFLWNGITSQHWLVVFCWSFCSSFTQKGLNGFLCGCSQSLDLLPAVALFHHRNNMLLLLRHHRNGSWLAVLANVHLPKNKQWVHQR